MGNDFFCQQTMRYDGEKNYHYLRCMSIDTPERDDNMYK